MVTTRHSIMNGAMDKGMFYMATLMVNYAQKVNNSFDLAKRLHSRDYNFLLAKMTAA